MDEPAGFAAFVDVHSRSLLRAGWLIAGDWATAEDLVQTSLAATWPRWETITPVPAAQIAYVHKVMVNTWLTWRRRRWTGEIPTEELPEPAVASGPSGGSLVDDRHDLQRALATLPPRQRTAIVLRYFVELSEAETALAMGCSIGTVKSHTHKAILKLRGMPLLAGHARGEG